MLYRCGHLLGFAMLRFIAAAAILVATSGAFAAEWTYTDGSGKTVTLPETPTRIVAHSRAASALITFGIRPVGIFLDYPLEDEDALRGLDLTGIEILGTSYESLSAESVLAAAPDLIIAEWWPLENAYGGAADPAYGGDRLAEIAPIVGPAQGASALKLIEDYAALAQSLGADLANPEIASQKADFEAALDRFKASVAAKPDLLVMAVSPYPDNLYVAVPVGSSELSDFENWGLNLVVPEVPSGEGYWEALSWEQAGKYQPDLLLVADRLDGPAFEILNNQPLAQRIAAVAAGQTASWPAFWLRNYVHYAQELNTLSDVIDAADAKVAN